MTLCWHVKKGVNIMSLCHNVELHWVLKWPKEPGTQIKGGLGWPCSACPPWCIILIITTLLIKSLIGIHQGTPELVGVPVEPHSLHRWGSHRARVTDATTSRAFFTSVTCARCEPVNRTGCQFCCSLMNWVALWWAVSTRPTNSLQKCNVYCVCIDKIQNFHNMLSV